MRHLLLFVLLLVGQLALGQKSKVDSLYADLKNHPQEDTLKLNIMFDICYWEGYSNPEKSKELAEQALSISKKLNYLKGQGRANRYLATYYNTIGERQQAITFAYDMLTAFEQLGLTKGIGQANQLLGIIHENELDYAKAKVFYGNALAIYESNNLKMDMGYANNSVGSLYLSMLQYDSALVYFLRALEVRKEIGDERGLTQSYGNVAAAYTNVGQYALALEYFDKALPLAQKLNMQSYIAIQYNNRGKLYTRMGNHEKANSYLRQAVEIAKKLGDKRILEDTYEKLVALEKLRGRHESALAYHELEMAYRDSTFTQEKAKLIATVEARYQTEKKNKQIQQLESEQKIHLAWISFYVVALVFVVLLSALIYFVQSYRENKNRKILNLQIDYLTAQYHELTTKPKSALPIDDTTVESHDQVLLKKAIAVVESNLSDPLFGIDKMAEEIGMSRSTLQRKIKSFTGFPPSELIRNIRLRKAAVMLRNKSDSVAQISFLVGFDDPSYFTKSFKKQFGVPPSEYLQSTKLVEALSSTN